MFFQLHLSKGALLNDIQLSFVFVRIVMHCGPTTYCPPPTPPIPPLLTHPHIEKQIDAVGYKQLSTHIYSLDLYVRLSAWSLFFIFYNRSPFYEMDGN